MAIIYSIHYITDAGAPSDADDAARQAARKMAVLTAYRLAHTAHDGGTANAGDTTLTPTIAGADNIAADGWYVIKIDTSKDGTSGNEDTAATAEALSGTAAGIDGGNQVWLDGHAAGREYPLTAFGGADEYIIASSFSEEVDEDHTDTVITITDEGVNTFRFREDVKIGAYSLDDDSGTLSIAFGANTHEALIIQNAATAKFKIGNGGTAIELSLRQFLHTLNKQAGEETGDTNDYYSVDSDVTAAPTGLPDVPDTPPITSLFFLPADTDNQEDWFNSRNGTAIGDATHTPHTTDIGTPQGDKWHLLTYNPLDDSLDVALSQNAEGHGQGTDAADAVWLISHLNGKTTTVSGAGGADTYYIASSFSSSAANNDGTGDDETHVTLTDTGRNIYRFRNGVIIKSAVIEDGALKVTFGDGTAPGLTINNVMVGGAGGNGPAAEPTSGPAAGSFRLGDRNDVAFTASEFVKFIRTEVAKPATPASYTVVDTLEESAVPNTITFTEAPAPDEATIDKSVQINRQLSHIPEIEANGMLIATPEMGTELAAITHNGADATYGDVTFTPNAGNTGGVWEYTPDPTDRDSLRLRDFKTSETITFTATDSTGAISTHNVRIDITVVVGTENRNLVVGDQYSGQATVIVRGVLFTVNDRGADANGIEIIVSRSSTSASSVLLNPDPNSSGKSVYNIFLGSGAVITPEFFKDLWDNRGPADAATARTDRITATIIDPDIPDATRDQILGRYIFRGGADDVTDAIADENDDKEVTLDWATPTNNDPMASGRLAILDPDDGSGGSTVARVSAGKYGKFTIPETGTGAFTIPGIESDDPPIMTDKGIFDWTYTLDPTDDDTRGLTGDPAVAASATLGGLVFTAKTPGAAMNGYNIVIQEGSAADANDALIGHRSEFRHISIVVPENAAEYPTLGKIEERLGQTPSVVELFDVTYAEGSTADDRLTALVPNTPLMGGAETKIYDLVTISVTDATNGTSFYDIPIAITVAGALREVFFTIGAGETAETYAQSGESTLAPASIIENPKSPGVGVYSGKVILANITATFFMGGDARAITPMLDAASVELGFAYDAMTGNITFNGRIDYESLALADANATAPGVQHRITLTARGGSASDGGVITTTHFVDVTIIDADQPPVINTAGITTHSDVSAAQATDIPADVTITGADETALYYAIDENETPSGALFTIPATDADGDAITYTLDARDAAGADVSGNFTIDTTTGDMTTGAVSLRAGAMLDHEASAYIRFVVTATSTSTLPSASGPETATQQVILLINDMNEDFVFTADSPTTVTISAHTASTAPISIGIGTVKAADPDEDAANVDVTYSLDGASETAGFMIDEDSGEITYAGAPIDLGTAQTKEFTLTITAMGGTSNPITHTLEVVFNDDTPPQPIIDTTITFDSGAFIFTRRQLDANDADTRAGDLTYTLTGLAFADEDAALQVYDSTGEMWTDLVADGSGSGASTFTQEQVNDGHVRLVATSDGTLSVRVSDETTTDAAPMEITFTARTIQELEATTEIGGVGDGTLNFNAETEAKTLTTGIGNTKITLGSGNDKVDAGLGDDAIDLGAGGEDVVIYRFATDKDGNAIAWSGGDSITGFTPGEDELVLSDVDGGDAAFIDGLETEGFVATLTTAYTGGASGTGSRDSIASYNVTGVEIHLNQAVVLPGGVLGGSILSVEFAVDAVSGQHMAWADFNTMWLSDGGFDSDSLLFTADAAGKAALTRILGLRGPGADIPVEALRSVAIGDGEANAIDLSGGNGASVAGSEWVIDGGGGDDGITLGGGTEEVIYRLAVGDDPSTPGTDAITAAPDGSDTISGFDLGTDMLTFVDTDGTPPTATPAPNEASAVDVLMTAIGAAGGVSLVYDGTNYTGITFGVVAANSGASPPVEAATLTITFAEELTADALANALGSTIADATALPGIFANNAVPTAGTAAFATLSTAGEMLIDTLFGMTGDENNISIGASLPAELL